jgi:hypothetical protein
LLAITGHLKRFKRGKRGISTVIGVTLSLVLVVIIVSNVFLWSYQMNQADWERTQEKIDILGATSINLNWTQNPSTYALGGSTALVSGSTSDLRLDDDSYMILRSYQPNTHVYVQSNASNVDLSANKGTESNFTAMQYGPDSTFDTLSEANTGTPSTFGSSTGSSYATVSANQLYGSVFTSPADAQGATIPSITWYGRKQSSGTGYSKAVLVLASTRTILAVSNTASVSNSAQERINTFASPPTISASTDYILMMIFDSSTRLYYGSGVSNQGVGDTTNSYASPTDPTGADVINSNQYRIRAAYNRVNYELDQEVQWTDVGGSQPNEQLCIYGGAMGSENIRVDVWTGTSWQNVFADLASGWNNVSVASYLTSQNFTIRFKGETETVDPAQDSWNIDAVLLHFWSDSYIAEVEFTGSSNTEDWTQLNWTVNSAWTADSVSVTIQLYNFTSAAYQTSGFGYTTYTSSATPNTDENSSQTTNTRASDFRDSAGNWKIKITGAKTGASQFDLKVDYVEFHEVNDETLFTFQNSGSLTAHIVSIWIDNSTSHQRFAADLFLNSGETLSKAYPNIHLPNGGCTAKVATERGNMAILNIS